MTSARADLGLTGRAAEPASPLDLGARALGITVYGCGPDEAAMLSDITASGRLTVRITAEPLSDARVALAAGHRYVSIGHKTSVENSALSALSRLGVAYVSSRIRPIALRDGARGGFSAIGLVGLLLLTIAERTGRSTSQANCG